MKKPKIIDFPRELDLLKYASTDDLKKGIRICKSLYRYHQDQILENAQQVALREYELEIRKTQKSSKENISLVK